MPVRNEDVVEAIRSIGDAIAENEESPFVTTKPEHGIGPFNYANVADALFKMAEAMDRLADAVAGLRKGGDYDL